MTDETEDMEETEPLLSAEGPPLSKKTMVELGFRPVSPLNNTDAVWWEHTDLGLRFTEGRPTAWQLLSRVQADGIYQGKLCIRRAIREALQI